MVDTAFDINMHTLFLFVEITSYKTLINDEKL